jgi:hypothetical protein
MQYVGSQGKGGRSRSLLASDVAKDVTTKAPVDDLQPMMGSSDVGFTWEVHAKLKVGINFGILHNQLAVHRSQSKISRCPIPYY